MARFDCLAQAEDTGACRQGSVRVSFLRVLRIFRIMRMARFFARMPTVRTQVLNLVHLGRRMAVFFVVLFIYYLVFAVLGAQLFCGRMYSRPSRATLVRGADCYCRVPGLDLPPASPLIGHPCELRLIDPVQRPWSPYYVALKEGFRKTDPVLASFWATAPVGGEEEVVETASLPSLAINPYLEAQVGWDERSRQLPQGRRQLPQGAGSGEGEVDAGVDAADAVWIGNRQIKVDSARVEIIAVTPRLNFDSFFSAFTTVFIIWTLTDWSFVMQPLLEAYSLGAVIYFALVIFAGIFFLQNLLAAAVIVEFRDRAHVRHIIELRDAETRAKAKFLALSGLDVADIQREAARSTLTKDESRRQNMKEHTERQKMAREAEERQRQAQIESQRVAHENAVRAANTAKTFSGALRSRGVGSRDDAAKKRTARAAARPGAGHEEVDEDDEHLPPLLDRVASWIEGKWERTKKKITSNAADTTCCCLTREAFLRRTADSIVYTRKFEKTICVLIILSTVLLVVQARRNSEGWRTISAIDSAINLAFIFECFLKVVARRMARDAGSNACKMPRQHL